LKEGKRKGKGGWQRVNKIIIEKGGIEKMCEYAGEKEEMYLEKKGYARSDEEKWMREMRIKMTSSRVE